MKNAQLKEFLENEANILFDSNPRLKKIVEQIRRNLAPDQPKEPLTPINDGSRQAFISYCHRDKDKCDSFVRELEQANIFTNIWIDKHHMKDDMVETITRAIRQSKIVFVLLSDEYCLSDFCRREWTFAREIRIKVYPVFVQKDFKRGNYDWVIFNIGSDHYFKIYQDDELKRLINILRIENNQQPIQTTETFDHSNETNPSPMLTTQNIELSNSEYTKKQSIEEWTSDDVQAWCHDKKLDKWCSPLTNYHGQALLELGRILSKDSHIQYVINVNKLTVFDVALFKCELDKLLSKPIKKAVHKKYVPKRRASKSSAK